MRKAELTEMRLDVDRACAMLESILATYSKLPAGARFDIADAKNLLAKWSLDDEPARGNTDD